MTSIRARGLLALALALLAAFAPLGGELASQTPAARAAVAGRLLLPRNSGLSVFELASGTEQVLYNSPQSVLGAAWAPDGGRVAFAQFGRSAGDRYASASLYLLEDGQATMVVQRGGPDQMLNNPIWTGDGGALIYDVSGGTAGGFSLELATLDGTQRQTLERGAASPALSPDGSLLAYVSLSSGADSLVVRPLAGGEAWSVLPPDTFIGINSPRFSPDGGRLAFLAVGDPSGPKPPNPINPLSWLLPGSAAARAHGLPWDPWVVNLDGSGLRRSANLAGDDPTVAWSPDGSTLALLGGDGLWLVPADGSGGPALLSNGSYGALDWRP